MLLVVNEQYIHPSLKILETNHTRKLGGYPWEKILMNIEAL
jgi:hypothetical protein